MPDTKKATSTPLQFSLLHAVTAAAGTGPTILVTEKLGEPGIKLLEAFGTVDTAYGLSPEDLCQRIKGADALIIRSATQVRAPSAARHTQRLITKIHDLLSIQQEPGDANASQKGVMWTSACRSRRLQHINLLYFAF